jgi:hypothetical protein
MLATLKGKATHSQRRVHVLSDRACMFAYYVVPHNRYSLTHSQISARVWYFRRVSTTLNPINFDDEHLFALKVKSHTHTHITTPILWTGAFFRLSNHWPQGQGAAGAQVSRRSSPCEKRFQFKSNDIIRRSKKWVISPRSVNFLDARKVASQMRNMCALCELGHDVAVIEYLTSLCVTI